MKLLESALARPDQLHAYGSPALFDLAAAYAWGLIRNHPFVDGHKRIGFMAAFIFLRRNGAKLTASEDDATETFLRAAAGESLEADLAAWFRSNSHPVST